MEAKCQMASPHCTVYLLSQNQNYQIKTRPNKLGSLIFSLLQDAMRPTRETIAVCHKQICRHLNTDDPLLVIVMYVALLLRIYYFQIHPQGSVLYYSVINLFTMSQFEIRSASQPVSQYQGRKVGLWFPTGADAFLFTIFLFTLWTELPRASMNHTYHYCYISSTFRHQLQ